MKTRTKIVIVTTVCAIFAFALGGNPPLGHLVWPAKELQTPPSAAQIPAFVAISIIEAVAFGLGVSFLAFGFGSVRRRIQSGSQAVATYLSIAWLLVSWFPHDNLHMFVGEDPAGLLTLLWGFHATLIAAGAVLAWSYFRGAGAPSASTRPTPRATGSG